MNIFEIAIALLTFPISIVALIINAIFHTGFWNAWFIVLIISLLIGSYKD